MQTCRFRHAYRVVLLLAHCEDLPLALGNLNYPLGMHEPAHTVSARRVQLPVCQTAPIAQPPSSQPPAHLQ